MGMKKNHLNQVRIIGGSHRGRKISFPSVEGLRPTADSVRERVFNWLGQDLTGKRVLDLFAGSGAMGLEAASRHAASVCLVEKNHQAARQLNNTAQQWALASVTVVTGDALSFLQHTTQCFDVVFLDPPYAWQQWPALLQALALHVHEDTLVYAEAARLPEWPPGWTVWRSGKSGISHFVVLHYASSHHLIA